MQNILIKIYKIYKHIILFTVAKTSKLRCALLFYLNGVKIHSFSSLGVLQINVSLNAKCIIGSNLTMNNGVRYSDSGVNGKCRIIVKDRAVLTIGDNVGMSDVTITCEEQITIGNNVLLGVGVQLRDTDSHSLNYQDRLIGLDFKNKKNAPILIQDNVFIGAYAFVLKGVTIGENAIVGACSVVTKDIPKNEIWAGNPAKLIGKLNNMNYD